jgi:hypothetical protein
MMNDAPEAELSKLLFEFSSFLHNVSHIRCQRKPQIELGDRTWRNIMNRADLPCVPKVPLLRLARPVPGAATRRLEPEVKYSKVDQNASAFTNTSNLTA